MIVLITGASGGLGPVLGKTLQERGMTVYGTSRTQQDDGPFPLLAMEITNDASVAACIQQVVEREGRIDVVINCVNRMIIGTVEEIRMEEIEQVFMRGVFGTMRVCKAVLPQLRKQGAGTIINMSSMGGLLAVPTMSAYSSSKSALEAFSEALSLELRDTAIDVVVMQPVAMNMDRPPTGTHLELAANIAADSPGQRMLKQMAKDTAASKLTPEIVSEKIADVIGMEKKPFRVPMDRARVMGVLKRLLPQRVMSNMVGDLVLGKRS